MVQFLPSARSERCRRNCTILVVGAFALALTSCGNSCFLFVSNPPTATGGIIVSNSPLACTVPKPQGMVRVTARLVSTCEGCSGSNRVSHARLSVRRVELEHEGNAEGGSWEELWVSAPDRPAREIDLQQGTDEERAMLELVGPVTVAAGRYRSVRLWLESNVSVRDRSGATGSECGAVGPNCLVFERHEPETVEVQQYLDVEMRVAPFVIAPETENEILVELVPVWSAGQVGATMRLQRTLVANGELRGPE